MKIIGKVKDIIKAQVGLNYPYTAIQKELASFALKNYGFPNKKYSVLDQIDIAMLTLNRLQDTKRTLESLYKTTLPFNLIIIDQKSDDGTREFLQEFAKQHEKVNLQLLQENLGVSGGRAKAAELATSEYLAFVDNDMIFMPGYFENLYEAIKEENVAGVLAKCVLPNRKIEVNTPTLEVKDGWAIFSDEDRMKRYDDPSTFDTVETKWIPMGVSIWKTKVLKEIPIDAELIGAYEDNDYTYRVSQAGYVLKNCPSSIVMHIKAEFVPGAMQDKNYTQGRFNPEKLQFAAKHFYKKHHLFLAFGDIEGSCKYLGFNSPDEYMKFIQS